jgi:hypothetical protein
MMGDEVWVVDVSRDGSIACDVQQRFMQVWIERRSTKRLDQLAGVRRRTRRNVSGLDL